MIEVKGNDLLLSSRSISYAQMFRVANMAAMKRKNFQRQWNLKYRGALIGTIRLAQANTELNAE